MTSIKFFALGDIHADFDLLSKALEQARREMADFVVLAGDLCDGDSLPSDASVEAFINQVEPLQGILVSAQLPVFFVPGNHDPLELLDVLNRPGITSLHDKKVEWEPYQLGGIGGSHFVTPQLAGKTVPFPEGNFPMQLNENPKIKHLRTFEGEKAPFLYSGVHLLYQHVFPCDVLITHTPALLPDSTYFHRESAGLYKLIAKCKPLIHISAHVHVPEVHVKTISWKNNENQPDTILLNLGSLSKGKLGLIRLSKSRKSLEKAEIVPLE